jgi:uncharacterized membrane protein YidH (DUF202 family)
VVSLNTPEKNSATDGESFRLEKYKFDLNWRLETFKSLVTHSAEGFKFLSLANGGAAVALLAYLGNFGNKAIKAPNMSEPMLWFLAGLVFAGAGWLFAYMTQLRLYQAQADVAKSDDKKHSFWLWFAAGAYVVSLALFAIGCIRAVSCFPV